MRVTQERRQPPSWLWNVTETKRAQLLQKRDPKGRAVWKIDPMAEEPLDAPRASISDLAFAKLELLAELHQEEQTTACADCGVAMSSERAIQMCEGCKKGTNKPRVLA